MAAYRTSSSLGRSTTNSRAANLIDVPKPGSVNVSDEEDVGQLVGRTPRRNTTSFSPHHGLGRNTLDRPKLAMTHTEVPPDTFYQRPDSAMATRGRQRPVRLGTQINSMLVGIPGPRNTAYKQSPPAQYRNAAIHMAGAKENEATSKAKREETIEINDSSEDEEVAAVGPSQRSVSQYGPSKQASGSRNAGLSRSQEGQDIFGGEARVPNPIRRKSESPPEDSKWTAPGAGIRILPPKKDSPELDPLPANRSFHIATPRQDEAGDKAQRPIFANRMKDREGKKNHLGGHMKSGLKRHLVGVSRDVKESPSRLSQHVTTSNSIQQRRLRLADIGFFGLAKITSATSDPTVLWNDEGDMELRWEQLGSKSLICKTGNMKLIETYDESTSHCVSISFMDPEKVVTRLCDLIGEAGSTVLKRAGKITDSIIMRPLTDHSGRLVEGHIWKDLLKSLRVSLASSGPMSRAAFIMHSAEFNGMHDFIKASESTRPTGGQPRPRPTAASRSIQSEQTPPRTSLRKKRAASGTEEEDEKASRASVEAVTKVQAPTGPQKALLSYPIAAPGAVNVFQSDLDKLNDQEMLNDTIVELGLRYLLEGIKKRNPELYEQIYVFSSFFYKRISEGKRDRKAAFEFVKKWTKKVDIFKKKYLVVPINEKLHWYLAIVTNPYYAVREVERRKGLYESEPEEEEEEEEKDVDGKVQVNGDAAVDGMEEEDAPAANVGNAEKRPGEQKETMGDTLMEEAKKTTVEVVIPQSSHKSDKSSRDKASEQMDLDEKPIFEKVDSPELEERAVEHRTLTTPVLDKRTARSIPRHAIDLDEDDDEVQVVEHSLSPRRAKKSTYRPGISDGIGGKGTGLGRGSLLGGGGPSGTPIEAGQIASFQHHQEEEAAKAAATKKRKAAEEDGDGDARMESPLPRSRSGAVYNGKIKPATYSRASSTETTQEKHQHWLKRKAVVCVFDSLGGTHKAVRTALREYFCLEYNDKKGGQIEVDEVELEHIDVVSPMQGNFCDCGLYLLHAFERFFHDPTHVMDEVIVSRDRTDPYWQAEDAAKKRQWWRECVASLIEEYKIVQAQAQADKEARKKGGKEKSGTTSPSDESRTATSGESPVDMASVESSLEEPTVSKAT